MYVLWPSNHFCRPILNSEQDRGFYWQFWAQIAPEVSGRNGFPNVQKPTRIIKLKNDMYIINYKRLICITNVPPMDFITSLNQI